MDNTRKPTTSRTVSLKSEDLSAAIVGGGSVSGLVVVVLVAESVRYRLAGRLVALQTKLRMLNLVMLRFCVRCVFSGKITSRRSYFKIPEMLSTTGEAIYQNGFDPGESPLLCLQTHGQDVAESGCVRKARKKKQGTR